jgi:hypothetical protein
MGRACPRRKTEVDPIHLLGNRSRGLGLFSRRLSGGDLRE